MNIVWVEKNQKAFKDLLILQKGLSEPEADKVIQFCKMRIEMLNRRITGALKNKRALVRKNLKQLFPGKELKDIKLQGIIKDYDAREAELTLDIISPVRNRSKELIAATIKDGDVVVSNSSSGSADMISSRELLCEEKQPLFLESNPCAGALNMFLLRRFADGELRHAVGSAA